MKEQARFFLWLKGLCVFYENIGRNYILGNNVILERAVDTIKKLRDKRFCLDFLFLFLSTWTLISAGSLAQAYIFKFITSDSYSIYNSAFESAINKMPDISGFIVKMYSLDYNFNYVAALFIVLIVLSFQTGVQVFFAGLIGSFLLISIADTFSLMIYGGMSIQALAECYISNLIGSPIVSSYLVCIFYIKKMCLSKTNVNNFMQHFTSYVLYLIICMSITIMSYYLVCFFYRPTVVDFKVSTSKKMSGVYFMTDSIDPAAKKHQEKFSILGKPVQLENAVSVYGKSDGIYSEFKKNETYKMKIRLLTNCVDGINLNGVNDSLNFENVQSFSLKSSDDMSIINIKDKDGHFKSSDEIVNMFSINNNTPGSVSINKKNNGALYYYPSDSNSKIYFMNSSADGERSQPYKKISFTLNINGLDRVFEVRVGKLRNENKNKKLICKSENINKYSKAEHLDIDEALLVGVLVDLEPESKRNLFSPVVSADDSHFVIKSSLLDIVIKDAKKENSLREFYDSGYVGGFLLYSFEKLSLNGKNVDSNDTDTVMFLGDDIYAHISEDNNLVVSGRANLFYRNSIRENKTLWELSSENTTILGLFGTAILGLVAWLSNKLLGAIRKDENINHF